MTGLLASVISCLVYRSNVKIVYSLNTYVTQVELKVNKYLKLFRSHTGLFKTIVGVLAT